MNNLAKNLLLWVIVAIVLMAVFQSFTPPGLGTADKPLTYDQFVQQVQADKVKKVVIDEDGKTIRGVNKEANTFLNSIPPVQGIVAVSYGTDVWGAEVSTKLAGKRDDVEAGSNAGFKAPGYAVFNASAWWRPTKLYDIELQVGVYNIFDRKYFDAVAIPTGALAQARDYYSEPGRTVKATLKYQF